jgi:quercetin dioxygenase-like cupin family protein
MQLDVAQPIHLPSGEGETITDRAERTIRILLAHELLDATWTRYEPGERGPDPHVHRQHVDSFYVLSGELEFGLGPEGRELVRAPAGTLVVVPPSVVHTFSNVSDGAATFLNLHAPSGGFAESLRARRDGRPVEGFDSFDPPAGGGRAVSETIVSLPTEGEVAAGELREHRVKADLPQLSVIELSFAPGWEGIDPHTHADHIDAFFVLDGEVEFTVGDDLRLTDPGTFVAAVPGARHGFRSDDHVRVLNLHAPDTGFAQRLRRRESHLGDAQAPR